MSSSKLRTRSWLAAVSSAWTSIDGAADAPTENDCAAASAAGAVGQAHRDDIADARVRRQRLPRHDQLFVVVKHDRGEVALKLIDHAAFTGRLTC